MLRLRVRLVKDNGQTDSTSRVLETTHIDYAATHNGAPTLNFTVSRDDFVPSAYPFVVRVEYSWNGGSYGPLPQHSHFIIETDDGDSKEEAKLATYSGQGFVPWLLAGALINWNANHKNNTRTWVEPGRSDASSGWIIAGMLNESKNAGWFPMLTWDFTNTRDSNNSVWPNGDKVNIPWDYSKNIAEVLNQLVEDSLCDWTTSGTQLSLYRPGTLGRDKSDLIIGGPSFDSIPVKVDSSNQYSHVRAAPEDLPWQNHYLSPDIRTRFGHRSIMVTQSGVKEVATSNKLIQPYLDAGKVPNREESYVWTPVSHEISGGQSPEVAPFKDFLIGDTVYALSRGAKNLRKIIGLVITDDNAPATVQAVVGDKITGKGTAVRNKLISGITGGAVSGSGSSFPATAGPSPLAPKAPLGLTVVSNTSSWIDVGTPQSIVKLAWAPVTAAIDGSEALVVEYEVWSRRPSENLSFDSASNEPELTYAYWTPGELRHVAVRAKSDDGIWGEFSNEIIITPEYPTSIVPKAPAQPTIVSQSAQFTSAGPVDTVVLTFPPVTQSTDDEPITIEEYELIVDGNATVYFASAPITVNIPTGVSREYRVRAKSELGVWGDPSPIREVIGNPPALEARTPTAPVLTTGAGNAFARWEGTYVSGGTLGAHSVRVEARIGAGAWVEQGTLISAGQQIIKIGVIGDTVAVRLRAYDQLGRLTGTSAESSIEVVGIPRADLDQAVNNFLDGLDELAGDAWDAASAAVKNTVTQYAVGSSDTVAPSSGWSVDTPTRTPGSFIWMRSVITFGNDSTSTTSPVLVTGNDGAAGTPGSPGAPGADGADGADGVGVTGTQVRYQVSTSATAEPTGTWLASPPAVPAGQFLWTRTVISYSNSTSSTSFSIAKAGETGATGATGGTGPKGDKGDTGATGATGSKGDKGDKGDTGPAGATVATITRYFRLSATTPTAPANPPTSPWTTSEPTYVPPSTDNLYYVDRTVLSNGSSSVSAVVLSSTYQAAKDAYVLANSALTTANGKNKIVRSTAAASSPGSYVAGDQWWQYSGSQITAMWLHSGSAWVAQTLTDSVITNLNAGTITAGYINAARINANTITGTHIASDTVTADNMVANTITAASGIIADAAITNAKIANLDAAKITTGTLNAARIGARSVTADKMLVSGAEELVPDPWFSGAIHPIVTGTLLDKGASEVPQAGIPANATKVLKISSRDNVPFGADSVIAEARPGERWRFEAWVVAAPTTTRSFQHYIYRRMTPVPTGANRSATAAGGSTAPTSTWTKVVWEYTIPDGGSFAGYPYMQPFLQVNTVTGDTPDKWTWYVTGWSVRRMAPGELIVDGAVKARHIEADEAFFNKVFTNELMVGRVETDHLSNNVGETLNITSNESVQIMVTQQEQLSSDVSAAQAAAENAQGLATDASIAAGEASGAAQTANNNAANAQDTAAQAAANIAAQQAVFVVTATGADVRSADATSIVRIVPSGISIVQNSTDVSSWSGSQFNVGQIVVRDVGNTQGRVELMGNHAIERSGTRTVFKKL